LCGKLNVYEGGCGLIQARIFDGLFGLAFFGSGGAARMRLAAYSKLTPFSLKSMALGIFCFNFSCAHFATFPSASKGKSQNLLTTF
jgi:hypothetical protein